MRKIKLRSYQEELYNLIKNELKTHKSICVESPTGSGKSVLLASIINAIHEKNNKWKTSNRVYIIVHQHFLLQQMSEHLDKWYVPHGLITGGKKERLGVNTHVCTIQSLSRRPPEKKPALFIIDECHRSGAKSYIELTKKFPDTKIIGVTASPERNDGKGLSFKTGGLYEKLIRCPFDMVELTELGYLAPIKYYAPPLPGIETVSIKMGDYSPEEIQSFLLEKGVYGDAIKHYEKIAPNTKCLVFCKSIKACYNFSDSLNERGYRAAPLEGKQSKKTRSEILERFEKGKLTHIVTCKLVLEGFDMPAIESILDLAPTLSRALWHQKKGRLARTFEGKKYGIYIDPVGNVAQNTQTGNIYEKVNWRFDYESYNKKSISVQARDMYCPICYAYIPSGKTCQECGAEKKITRKEKKTKKIDGELVEIVPVPMKDRDIEERKKTQDEIAAAIQDSDITTLYQIALTITTKKKAPLWIYHQMNTKKLFINMELLFRIQRQLGYKPGWVYFAKKLLERKKHEFYN